MHTAQDRQDIVKCFDKTWFTGEGNENTFMQSCLENSTDRMKRQKDMIPEDEPPPPPPGWKVSNTILEKKESVSHSVMSDSL